VAQSFLTLLIILLDVAPRSRVLCHHFGGYGRRAEKTDIFLAPFRSPIHNRIKAHRRVRAGDLVPREVDVVVLDVNDDEVRRLLLGDRQEIVALARSVTATLGSASPAARLRRTRCQLVLNSPGIMFEVAHRPQLLLE